MILALLVLLAAPQTLRVAVAGKADQLLVRRKGVVVARATVREGRAEVRGLAPGRYDLQAVGPGVCSTLVRGVPTAPEALPGVDARLEAVAVHRILVRTAPGALVWSGGIAWEPERVLLASGLHRVVADHPERVSSAERWIRVSGPKTIDLPLEAGLIVTGQVTDPGGSPLPGAVVEAFADGYATGRRTLADDRGRFGLSGFRGAVISLRIQAPGYARRLVRVLFSPGEERARVHAALVAGSCVRVAARDTLGRPLAEVEGILLAAWYEEVLEEPRLRANHDPVRLVGGLALTFAHLLPGRRYRILLRAPGYRPRSTPEFTAPSAARCLELAPVRLERGGEITGRTGREGVTVRCQGPEGVSAVRAGRGGRFAFPGLDPGEHLLRITGLDERPTAVQLGLGERRSITLEIPAPDPDRVIRGLVLDADEKPLGGVIVEAGGLSTLTDGRGAFRLVGIAPGRKRWTVRFRPGPVSRAFREDPHLPRVERGIAVGAELHVRLERAGKLWLRFDASGRRLARARLRLEGSSGTRIWRQLPRGAQEVRIGELPVGTYVVEVAAPGLLGTGGAVAVVRPHPAAPVPITLLPGRTAAGRVMLRRVEGIPGTTPLIRTTPFGRGWVVLFDADPLRSLAVAPVEEDGGFVLDGLPAAAVLLCACAPGYPVAFRVVDLRARDARDLELRLEAGAEAAVKVLGKGGRPLGVANARFFTEQGIDIRDLAARARFRQVVAGEADCTDLGRCFQLVRGPGGRLAAPFLAPGSYKVLVTAGGYASQRLGVRARRARAVADLRRVFPGVPPDLASPVWLVPEAKD